MRPSILDPLFGRAAALPGIGPKTAKLFDRLLAAPGKETRLVDILFHLPINLLDRSLRPTIAEAPFDQIVVLKVRVAEHRKPQGRYAKAPYKILVEDDTGDCELVFFLANADWIERSLPLGATRWVSGKLELYDGRRQIVHPDRVLDEAGIAKLPPAEAVHGLTEGLQERFVQRAVEGALERLPSLPEWQDPSVLAANKLPDFATALREAHHPTSRADVEPMGKARQRLALDELLSQQLALRLLRAKMKRLPGRENAGDGRITQALEAALPFALTGAQTRALAEIRADLSSSRRMLRLLQGDVGSGKTIVALLAMASVVECGRQAALMAPTEILARQHYEKLLPLAEGVGLRLALLTGRAKASERARLHETIAKGEADIVIGTHSLVQSDLAFADLGLAVIDEQHRFGVQQRLALGAKGEAADVLVMTATPIPRSLALTYFGDMDSSVLDEKPPGRTPIDTRALPVSRIGDVVEGVRRALGSGARVYWVCPLVEENEELDLAAAQDRHDDLTRIFGEIVGLVHGRMKGAERDAAMEAFKAGTTRILVATTVIEVGVDVPEATVMVIEHAERFGLAQLHQLRGRVGRGSGKSSCLLLYKGPLGETAKARLVTLRQTEDGFRIAEEDLRLRGEGEVLGSRQSGLPGFRLADIAAHARLLATARDDAELILRRDPELASPRGEALRVLLYLFERDEAVRLLRAG
ncbi:MULTISPECIES: ATP-dependent DNA helicase RecG [Methylosinus]|uniref:ATP-dependent DNA helicase RecG n=1 Tax=Methylosinus trichosporium (strain ATCC 35070 / NCIMB 11131 / UNIQEM 75 / OB3b) TaxID=595536 RepID=A0A2D2CV65_METT3|nr:MULTISPECIES: ATP-dependent DNA helicase RecG [Methylosinus]ATQ66721.1 ATP-dependent DNA helicase RecG [Methylosinus trichosporium OB3b]OBS53388.1 ATP-dependent DNA helicase RecG [Methylosinus sp. 3S-1]